jgi:hydroxypyruvate isomerase
MPIWSAHISLLFAEHPWAERPGLARATGFDWIEAWWPETHEEREALVAGVAEQELHVSLLNTDGGDLAAGERGHLCDPAREESARQVFLDGLELAARLRSRVLHVLVGKPPEGLPPRTATAQAAGMLRELVPEATARGIAVVVESLNPIDQPGYLTPTPEAVYALVEEAGVDGLGLLLDSFQTARIGLDPAAEARRFAGVIGHVQVAEAPGRTAPGTGDLDLPGFLAALDEVGYDGPIGLEYHADGDTIGSLAFLDRV